MIYRPKVNQPIEEASPKMAPSADKKKVLTTCNSSKKTGKTNASTSGNGTFSLSNSFEALNIDNTVTNEVNSGGNTSKSGVHEEGKISTPLVEKINMFEQQLLAGNVCFWMMRFPCFKTIRVGYGTNSLLEQWRKTYGKADYDYEPYDDDMHKGQEICVELKDLIEQPYLEQSDCLFPRALYAHFEDKRSKKSSGFVFGIGSRKTSGAVERTNETVVGGWCGSTEATGGGGGGKRWWKQQRATGSMANTSSMQEEGHISTYIVDKINVLETQMSEGKHVFVNDDGKLVDKVDYLVNFGSDDEVESS
ncbi:hypothetical protein Tco_0386742 [Tanacetum coccineum]